MRAEGCYKCIYACFDAEVWLRQTWSGLPPVPTCANHPGSPGQLREVTGRPCRNFRRKPATPSGDIRRIPVGGGLYALVDAADYEWLSKHKWSCYNGYAARYVKGKPIFMHREIMRPPKGKVVDHIDGNRLNDCRANMRNCKPLENTRNRLKCIGSSSQYKGVYYCKRAQRYFSTIKFGGKQLWLGYYDDEIQAAYAYDRKAVELGIEFARLNFPEEWPPAKQRKVHAQWLKENGKQRGKRRKAKAASAKRHAKTPARKPRKRPVRKAKRTAGT